jgi:hypothetical protein
MDDRRLIVPKAKISALPALKVDIGLKVTGDGIEDLAAFLAGVSGGVAGPEGGVEGAITRSQKCLLDFEGRQ